jgi:hypothetical protein
MNVALDENSRYFGVKTHSEEHGGQFDSGLAQDAGLLRNGERMEVNDAVEHVSVMLARHPVDQSAQMVAKVNRTGGLNTGKDARHAETLLPMVHRGMVGLSV